MGCGKRLRGRFVRRGGLNYNYNDFNNCQCSTLAKAQSRAMMYSVATVTPPIDLASLRVDGMEAAKRDNGLAYPSPSPATWRLLDSP